MAPSIADHEDDPSSSLSFSRLSSSSIDVDNKHVVHDELLSHVSNAVDHVDIAATNSAAVDVVDDANVALDSSTPLEASSFSVGEDNIGNRHILIRKTGLADGYEAIFMIDSGASHDFVSMRFLERTGLIHKATFERNAQPITTATGSAGYSTAHIDVEISLGEFSSMVRLYTGIESDKHDIVLGKSWLFDENPVIDWRTHEIRAPPSPREIHMLSRGQTYDMLKDPTAEGFVVLHTEKLEFDGKEVHVPGLEAMINEYDHVFPDDLPATLPPKRHVDHAIPLEPGSITPKKKMYRLSTRELQELKHTLDDLLSKGWIRPSASPYGAPVLFVAKKDGSLRMVIDYRALNSITIKNSYPLPRQDELFNQLQGAKVFSKLDLRSGYHQIRVQKQDVPKTAFLTRYGLMEWTVLPFGLTSAPGTFMQLMNDIFRDYLDQFVVVYLDDILVYSKNVDDHVKHVRCILERLAEHKLYAKKSKCQFGMSELEFLGHIVTDQGLKADPRKVKAIAEWTIPQNVRDIQSFLGLANYYRAFIRDFATAAAPLNYLLRKDVTWHWGDDAQKGFKILKQRLCSAPVLALPDPEKRFHLHTDASSVAVGGVLSQTGDDDLLHPVAYASRSLKDAEYNYPVHELELLAIKYCLDEWRHHLDGPRFTVYTDNRSLATLKTNTNLSKRQIRWLQEFQSFVFDIHHIPRERNHAADALSKRPPVEPSHPNASFELHTTTLRIIRKSLAPDILRLYYKDDFCKEILQRLRTEDDPTFSKGDDGLLIRQATNGVEQVVVPRMSHLLTSILHENHDSPEAGHRGIDTTMERIQRSYYWPGMHKTVRRYIATCDTCQRTKASNAKPAGLLQPLQLATERWQSISIDFITHLPMTQNGHDAIATFVDRFTKRAHFAPCKTTDTAEDFAHLFLREIYRQHGLPSNIVSDRDPKFTSRFWAAVSSMLGTERHMSSASHPQSDGQTERTNRTIEELLRCYVAYDANDWDLWIPVLEHTYNDSLHTSIGMTPFECDLGRSPSSLLTAVRQSTSSSVESATVLVSKLENVKKLALQRLEAAVSRQKTYADTRRRELSFNIGDLVLVDLSVINPDVYANAPSRKILPRRHGPFKVTQRIGDVAYKVDLPSTIRAHNVFHVSVLSRYQEPDEPSRRPEMPPPVITKDNDDENEWEVERILNVRIRGRQKKKQYLVKWVGYPLHDATWEPESNLVNAADLVADFEKSHTRRPQRKTRK